MPIASTSLISSRVVPRIVLCALRVVKHRRCAAKNPTFKNSGPANLPQIPSSMIALSAGYFACTCNGGFATPGRWIIIAAVRAQSDPRRGFPPERLASTYPVKRACYLRAIVGN